MAKVLAVVNIFNFIGGNCKEGLKATFRFQQFGYYLLILGKIG